MPAFGAHIPPLIRQTKTRIFSTRAIWRAFERPHHDGDAAGGVKWVFTREQLLQKFSYGPTSTDGGNVTKAVIANAHTSCAAVGS